MWNRGPVKTGNKNSHCREKQTQTAVKQASCLLPAWLQGSPEWAVVSGSLYPPTDCAGQPSHEPPQKEATLHKVKPNYFGVVARNRTWPGEGISFLVKKVHLYTNSIFTEEGTLEMAEESACIPAGTPKHHHQALVTDMKIKHILMNWCCT